MTARGPGLRYGSPAEAGLSATRLDRARELAAGWVEDGTHPALEVLVARRGVIALHEAFGKHGPDAGAAPLKCEDLFATASLIKPVAAAALMCLVEDGLVGLTRPVQEYISEFTGDGREEVCVHHLLTHTSGLYIDPEEQFEVFGRRLSEPRRYTDLHPIVDALLQMACELPLTHRPGEEMFYSTFNYELLGEVIRRVSGTTLQELASERIFGPLEMHDTWFALPEDQSERVVTMASDVMLAAVQPFAGVGSPSGAVGCYTTGSDAARFCQMFLDCGRGPGGAVLHPSSIRAMAVNQIPGVRATGWAGEEHAEASWSFGWQIGCAEKWKGYPLFSSGGLDHGGGLGSIMWLDPETELVGVYMSYAEWDENRQLEWGADLWVNAVSAALED